MGRVAWALAVLGAVAGVARSQPDRAPADRAKQLYNAAAGYYADKDYVASAIVFEQAQQAYGEIVDATALIQQRKALFYEVSAYSLANQPVAASAALIRYRDLFATTDPEVIASCHAATVECDRAQLDASLAGLEARVGTLTLRGVPEGAIVFVDNRVLDRPGSAVRLTAGDHLIDVRADQRKPLLRTIQIEGTKDLQLDIKLESSETPARVRIEATIDGARVALDGGSPTAVPVEVAIPPGTHRYRVVAETYMDQEGSFVVEPGQRTVIKAGMVVRRAPLGLRVDPYFIGTFYLRQDTPFGTRSAGIGLHVSNDHRYKSVQLGFAFEYQARPLDPIGVGGVASWCPDATTSKTVAGIRAIVCPVNVDAHMVFGGHVGPGFVAGTGDGRLSTAFALQDGSGYVRLAVGVGLVTYQLKITSDSPSNKWLATSNVEIALGLDL